MEVFIGIVVSVENIKRYECKPTPICKPSRLRRREMNVTAKTAIDIGNTTEETVNANETNPVPVEKAESAKIKRK